MKTSEEIATLSRVGLMKWAKTLILGTIGLFMLAQYLDRGGLLYLVIGGISASAAFLIVLGKLTDRAQDILLSCATSALFLDLAFAQIDFHGLLRTFKGLSYFYLIPSTVLLVLSSVTRAYRWKWFLPVGVQTPFWSRFLALNIGLAANQILPARAGEFIRAYVFGRRTQLSKAMVFATVVLERIFDGLTVLLFLILVALIIGIRASEMRYMGLVGATFYLGAIVALFVVYFQEPWLERQIGRVLPGTTGHQAANLLRAFADGLAAIGSIRQLLLVAGLSLATWALVAASFWPVLSVFNFGVAVPLYTPFLLVAVLGLGLMIPAAPAGVGVFQYACLLTLQIVFAPHQRGLAADFIEQAAAFSLVVHVSQVVPELLMGGICFLFEGLNWKDVNLEA